MSFAVQTPEEVSLSLTELRWQTAPLSAAPGTTTEPNATPTPTSPIQGSGRKKPVLGLPPPFPPQN